MAATVTEEKASVRSEATHATPPEESYKFNKHSDMDDEMKEAVVAAHRKHKSESSLPRVVEKMKRDLDAQFGKGWVVFAGMHMTGACSYITKHMLDFEVDGVAFVVFQAYCPPQ